MKQVDRINDEELMLLDSINKMSRQVSYTYRESNTIVHSELLLEIIESMKEQFQALRNKRGVSNSVQAG